MKTKTGDEVRADLESVGLSLAEWARAQHVSYDVARGVVSGRIKAKRGEAHRIAVALGMKDGRIVPARLFSPIPPTKGNLKLVRKS